MASFARRAMENPRSRRWIIRTALASSLFVPIALKRYYNPQSTIANVHSAPAPKPLTAIALLSPDGGGNVRGVVKLSQATPTSPTVITASVSGLTDGPHGIHIHEFGDITGGCMTAGAHYNPFNKTHGGPTDAERHVGDLGNIVSKSDSATYNGKSELIQLSGVNSVIGRTMVVHADEDDLGKGNAPDSKTTGHAGKRVACGVIGIGGN